MKKLKISCIILLIVLVLTYIFKESASFYDKAREGELVPILDFACMIEFFILAIVFVIYITKNNKNNELKKINNIKRLKELQDNNVAVKVIYDIFKNQCIRFNNEINFHVNRMLCNDEISDNIYLKLSLYSQNKATRIIIGYNENGYYINSNKEKINIDSYSYDEILDILISEIKSNYNPAIKNNKTILDINNGSNKHVKISNSIRFSLGAMILSLAWIIYSICFFLMIVNLVLQEKADEQLVQISVAYKNEIFILTIVCISISVISLIVAVIEAIKDNKSKNDNIINPITIAVAIISVLIFITANIG